MTKQSKAETITDEQVDAACAAYDAAECEGGNIGDCLRAAIRAAITQSDPEPYYRWKFALNDYQVGNLIDAIGQSVDNGDWYGEFCNMVEGAMKQLGIEKLSSNRGNEYTLEDIQARNIRRPMTHPALACPDDKLAELVSRWEARSKSDTEPAMQYDTDAAAQYDTDMDRVIENLPPREHQDPSKWVSKEDMERAHNAEPVAWQWRGRLASGEMSEWCNIPLYLYERERKQHPEWEYRPLYTALPRPDATTKGERPLWASWVKLRTSNAAPPRPDASAGPAEPVAWRYRYRVSKDKPWSEWVLMPSTDGKELCDKYPENYETQGLGVITVPPRPDVSAGPDRSSINGERGGVSWGGHFYVEGNKESIDEVRSMMFAKTRCEALDKMISEKQLVRPDVSAGHEIGKAIRQEQEMSTRDELNQANNRNGDLLTTISKLQKRIVELETGAEPVAWRVKDFADNWILCTQQGVAEIQAENASTLIQPLYTSPPRPDASAEIAGPPPNQGSGGRRPALEVKITNTDASSAGLIEAARHLTASADQIKEQAESLLDVGTDECKEQAAELAIIEPCLRAEANYLRARAADRSKE